VQRPQAQRPQPLTTRPLQLLQACMKQPRPKPQRQELHAWTQQRPQPLSTRPLQLLQACMKQPRPKLQMQELQISWAQLGLQPLDLQSLQLPWPLALQAKGSQPLIRGGAVGLEIAISSRRADEIGDDASGSPNILETPARHPG
jgi:hypothetical protein